MIAFVSCIILCAVVTLLFYKHYYEPYYVLKKALGLSGPSPRFYHGNGLEIAELGGPLNSSSLWCTKYGHTFLYYLGLRPIVQSQDLNIIKSVMVKNFDSFVNHMKRPRLVERNPIPGILRLRDGNWRKARRTLTPTFSSRKLKVMVPFIQETCSRLSDKISVLSDSKKSTDVWRLFGEFTMDTIMSTAFGRSMQGNDGNVLIKAAAEIFQFATSSVSANIFIFWSHFPWLQPLITFIGRRSPLASRWDVLEGTALKLVEDRRKDSRNSKDLLQLLLEAHEEVDNEQGVHKPGTLSNDEIVAAIITILLAGYETTSNSLAYTAYLLAINPNIQDKLIQEIQSYFDANPSATLYDAAENVMFLTMVLSESLRLYPPAARTDRECRSPCAVSDNLVLQVGTVLEIPIYQLHHNPDYWEDPEKFDPDRFATGKEQSYPMFAYMPFGEGPRNCLGKRLALLEAKMVLVAILKDYRFNQTVDTEVPLSLTVGITMSPKNGVHLSFTANCTE